MTVEYRVGVGGIGTVPLGDVVYLGDIPGFTSRADGSTGMSGVLISDPDATLDIIGLNKFEVDDDACDNPRIFTGHIANRVIKRGSAQRVQDQRVWDTNLADQNNYLMLRIIRDGNHGNRPAETDVERIAWLLDEVLPDHAINGTGGIFGANGPTSAVLAAPRNLDAADYRGQYAADVLADIGPPGNRRYFCYWDPDLEAVCLFYGLNVDYLGTASIAISNVNADLDSTTFAPYLLDASLDRDPSAVYGAVLYKYRHGTIYREDAGTIATYLDRGVAITNERVGLESTASTFVDRILDKAGTERDDISVTIRVPPEHVNHVIEGQRISVRFSHLPGYESPVYMHVLSRTVIQDKLSPEFYDIKLELSDYVGGFGSGGSGSGSPLELCHDDMVEGVEADFDTFDGRTETPDWGDASSGPTWDGPQFQNNPDHTSGVSGGFGIIGNPAGEGGGNMFFTSPGGAAVPWRSGIFTMRSRVEITAALPPGATAYNLDFRIESPSQDLVAQVNYEFDSGGAGIGGATEFDFVEDTETPPIPADSWLLKWEHRAGSYSRLKVWHESDPEPTTWLVERTALADLAIDDTTRFAVALGTGYALGGPSTDTDLKIDYITFQPQTLSTCIHGGPSSTAGDPTSTASGKAAPANHSHDYVAAGGTTGQVLTKLSDADWDTTWDDPSGGTDLSAIDFLVGTASGDLSSEIVVGTTPGGELGGTWASPTVDATHSGSSHAATQAAAEATAAAALSGHTGDTTDAHDASAISFSPTGTISATDVQAAIAEVAAEAGGVLDPDDVRDAGRWEIAMTPGITNPPEPVWTPDGTDYVYGWVT